MQKLLKFNAKYETILRILISNQMSVVPEPGGPGGPLAPPIFGRSVNPIPIGEGRLSPPITTGTPNVFHLPASLIQEFLRICFLILEQSSLITNSIAKIQD